MVGVDPEPEADFISSVTLVIQVQDTGIPTVGLTDSLKAKEKLVFEHRIDLPVGDTVGICQPVELCLTTGLSSIVCKDLITYDLVRPGREADFKLYLPVFPGDGKESFLNNFCRILRALYPALRVQAKSDGERLKNLLLGLVVALAGKVM